MINVVAVSALVSSSQNCTTLDWILVGPIIFQPRTACVLIKWPLVLQHSDWQPRMISYCMYKNSSYQPTLLAPTLYPHLSWDNDQLYTLHTVHYRVVLCSGQKNWATVPQFHSIFWASMLLFPHSTWYPGIADQLMCNFCIAGDTLVHYITAEGTCEL